MRYFYSIPACEVSPGPVLFEMIDRLRGGDILAIPNVTHVAVRWIDLELILQALEQRSARLEVQHTSGKLGEPPEVGFKRDLRRAAGRRAQSRGAYERCGRPRKVDRAAVRGLADTGLAPKDIAKSLGYSMSSVYRALGAGS